MRKLMSAIKEGNPDAFPDYSWRTYLSSFEKSLIKFFPEYLELGKELMELNPEELKKHFEKELDENEFNDTPEELLEEYVEDLRDHFIGDLSTEDRHKVSLDQRKEQGLIAPYYFRVDELSFLPEDVINSKTLWDLDNIHFEDQKKRMGEDPHCKHELVREEDEVFIGGDWVSWLQDGRVYDSELLSLETLLGDMTYEIEEEFFQKHYPHKTEVNFKPLEDEPNLSSLEFKTLADGKEEILEALKKKVMLSSRKYIKEFIKENAEEHISIDDTECEGLDFLIILGSRELLKELSIKNFPEDLNKISKKEAYKDLKEKFKVEYRKFLEKKRVE